ncbi:MAG: hypothetical protein SGJ04_07525 [Bacteroidota bacterium]|nr:hypothetical protein [Bacteroidota bacterium]
MYFFFSTAPVSDPEGLTQPETSAMMADSSMVVERFINLKPGDAHIGKYGMEKIAEYLRTEGYYSANQNYDGEAFTLRTRQTDISKRLGIDEPVRLVLTVKYISEKEIQITAYGLHKIGKGNWESLSYPLSPRIQAHLDRVIKEMNRFLFNS